MNKITVKKEASNILVTLFAAIISALGLHVFVYPSSFAPSGVDGIATMLQELTHINAGLYSLLFNIPLLILAWFFLKKRYVYYTLLFTVLSSGLIILLDAVDFYQFASASDRLIPAIFSGVILGVRTGVMLKIGASTGGIDIVAGVIQIKKPHINIERIITVICYIIILSSYFIYQDITSILVSFVQMFVFDKFAGSMLKDSRSAVEVKIITKHPEDLKQDIIYNLKHGATVVDSKGMYTDDKSAIIISVINIRQIPEFIEIIKKYPDTFAYYSELMGVKGNFRWRKDDIAK